MPDNLSCKVSKESVIEAAMASAEAHLKDDYPVSKRTMAVLFLENDEDVISLVRQRQPEALPALEGIRQRLDSESTEPLEFAIALRHQKIASAIASRAIKFKNEKRSFNARVDRLLMQPFTGGLVLLAVLYWGIYQFVGVFAAGTIVNYLENTVFIKYINPWMIALSNRLLPWEMLRELFVGEYGVLTLGLRYAVALILPIVTFFFIVFAVIEDTGYLPRLAMLLDRIFKKIGLSGRAVIPLVLGFGCATMATVVTRTLPTKRERILTTLLLSLAVPCSAQLGVILAILSGRPRAMLAWAVIIGLVFFIIGFLASGILPGERPSFYMELPPLRLPNLWNIFMKTYVRVKWYFFEILPIFLFTSVLIWVGQRTGTFGKLIHLLEKPSAWMGLPKETAEIFLFGFFRRDYGAAGLYDLNHQGILSGRQLAVSCVALTLFLPCVAQFLVNIKERGLKWGLGISIFILFFSFTVAFIANFILQSFGVV
ncbi:MAG: ferrous iron transporter B [Candidatus Omnitrophica bacterium CG1_02_49_16]|nr:MAG: ferrous iron transporter B [Candidatus Omnitrophica bacterium CG1_02_49_16]